MKKLLFLSLAGILIFATGCKSYSDGPLISFKKPESRIVNTWIPEKVYDEQGNDITSQFEDISYLFNSDGTLEIRLLLGGVFQTQSSGTWAFINKKDQLVLNYSGTFITAVDTLTILRLKSNSFWYKSQYGKEFHLLPEAR